MSIGIYIITNKINNKSYIGQSINIEKRIKTHFWAAFKENLPSYNYHIYQAIRKYGEDNFTWEILETIQEDDPKKLDELEQFYIKKYDSFKHGYNMNEGGNTANQNKASGENNGKAKLTKQDVINIREAYNNHSLKREVYQKYKNRISESGFHKIWNWETWKNVVPEYHSQENIYWHSHQGKALSSEQASLNAGKINKEMIFGIRELSQNNFSNRDIIEILNLPISEKEVERIIKKERFESIV
jgi:group I intron endonuclease